MSRTLPLSRDGVRSEILIALNKGLDETSIVSNEDFGRIRRLCEEKGWKPTQGDLRWTSGDQLRHVLDQFVFSKAA